ncbi:MAG: glycosyltransferase family 2 protein [Bacteroidia bacterium]|nr:glycosyltransferase family 2 protein [Bacteroidia bacterium]
MTPAPATPVWVIVPAYQEGTMIRDTLTPLLAMGYQVILVDDASTDETRYQVAGLPVHYLRHGINLGQGAALETGMAYARLQGADWVVHFDADGQHQVADIPVLLAPLLAGTADIVLGSRFMSAAARALVPPGRRRLLRVAAVVNLLLTGLRLTDAHNGLRALNAHALSGIRLHQNRMAHATEILQEIHRLRLRWQEVPVTVTYSPYARQKGQRATQAWPILRDLILHTLFHR